MDATFPEYQQKSIILLGMPGSGKTTLGRKLSAYYSKPFVDTDHAIERNEEKSLQDILNTEGYLALRAIEERTLLTEGFEDSIVSTGGSAVYSRLGMQRLKKFGCCVYLSVPISELNKRIDNFARRGIAASDNYSLDMLFEERDPLYRRYADVIVDVKDESVEQTLGDVIKKLNFQCAEL